MRSVVIAAALALCSTAAVAKHHNHHRDHWDDRSYYRGEVFILGPGGVYFATDNGRHRHHGRKYKRCWYHHGNKYCKYYYRRR
ncbi:MAG: hypothetical protein AB7I18_10945 [Candidatus Berkiella sp.]